MGAFSNCISCSLGSNPVSSSYQLSDYAVKANAVLENGSRIATEYQIDGEGWIEKTTQADYSAEIAAAIAAWSTDAQDFVITGVSGATEVSILAKNCIEGGPHFDCTLVKAGGSKDGGSGFRRNFNFTVKAKVAGTGSANSFAYSQSVETSADGAQTITRKGSYSGPSADGSAMLLAFRLIYPLPGWVVTSVIEPDAFGSKGNYTFTATEVLNPFPLSVGTILDGEGSMKRSRDENYRMTQVWSFDFSFSGNPYSIQDGLRDYIADGADGPAVREELEFQLFRNNRLRASFTYLLSAENDGMLEYKQIIREQLNPDTFEQIAYEGASPALVKRPDEYRVIDQSGYAIGIGDFPDVPAPLYPDAHSQKPEIVYEEDGIVERKVSWHYVMFVDGSAGDGNDGGFGVDFQQGDLNRPDGGDDDE